MCNGHFFSFAGAKLRISEHIAKEISIFFSMWSEKDPKPCSLDPVHGPRVGLNIRISGHIAKKKQRFGGLNGLLNRTISKKMLIVRLRLLNLRI